MYLHKNFFTFIIVTLASYYAESAEYVPVFMWGTTRFTDHVSGLHKTSEDSFKDTLLEGTRNHPYIVVFAEPSLSPEDFAQRDINGDSPYGKLSKLRTHNKVSYNPYVQNPIGSVRSLGRQVTEIAIKSLISNLNVPKDNILIIDLNDASEDESRIHMLKRHDSDIAEIYNDLAKQHKNILAIYTAHHTSWIEPEASTVRKSRSLLQNPPTPVSEPGDLFNASLILLYFNTNGTIYTNNATSLTGDGWTAGTSDDDGVLTLTKATAIIRFLVSPDSTGYWYLNNITVAITGSEEDNFVPPLAYAPYGFSYHCESTFRSGKNSTLRFPALQLQFFNKTTGVGSKFGDAYDCVGFTSIPIWSGLFVTFILLSIITFGLTMMMDIRTMDRFDDAKGKTITVNVAE